MQIKNFLFGFLLIVLPTCTKADIIITEIMYDPEGTDTGREWIEIKNIEQNQIDVANYKFLESGVNHKLTLYKGNNTQIQYDEHVVIADNAEKFMLDFPNFSGKLFDSAFSLVNTGEELKIITESGTVADTITYDPNKGGQNTGNSLQFSDFGFIPGDPTPAHANVTTAENEVDETSGNISTDTTSSTSGTSSSVTNSNSTHSSSVSLTNYKPKTTLSVGSGRDRLAQINTPIEFVATHNQSKEDEAPKFKWSMGDGLIKTGRKFTHIFEHSGVYNVVLNSNNSDSSAVSRSKITIFEPNVDILLKNSGEVVEMLLKNLSSKEINLGDYYIEYSNKRFNFPRDTIISASQSIKLNSSITKFKFTLDANAKLYYPNDTFLTESKNENLISNTQQNI